MEEELISVIVPVFNVEDYLPRCLECIGAQTYRNLEIILVDNGSTDGSGHICDEYAAKDSRARVIHQPNTGCWAARNTGQDAATGEYLWFPDGDDYFHKDIVKIMHEAINRRGSDGKKYDLAMVGCKRTIDLDHDVAFVFEPSYVEKSIVDVWDSYLHPIMNFVVTSMWNKLFRKTNIKDIRTGNYKYAQDCDFVFQVLNTNPTTIFVDNDLYYWTIRSNSAMQSEDYPLVRILCRTRIEYLSLMSCKVEAGRRYLLEALYNSIVSWLELVNGNDNAKVVRHECREMIRNTWWDYLTCREIRSFQKRLNRILNIWLGGLPRFLIDKGKQCGCRKKGSRIKR